MDLLVASIAVALPMGQQVYEEQVVAGLADVLPAEWQLRRCIVRTLRSTLPGTARLPSALLGPSAPLSRRVAGIALYRRADLVHRMDLRLPPAAHREVVTVHDVAPWRFDDEGRLPKDCGVSARRARVVVCPSAFAAGEVSEVLGVSEPVVIPNGVGEAFFGAYPLSERDAQRYGIVGRYVVHAGGCTRRKNVTALADAWPIVKSARPDVTLVLAGPPDPRRDALFAGLGGVVRVGRVPSPVLVGLVAGASAVVVPSLYEGFGLPALEAMAAGTPVVAARRAALPEVCGDAAQLVEPDGRGLADGLVNAIDRPGEIESMVERGRHRAALFTWKASAERHVRAWKTALE